MAVLVAFMRPAGIATLANLAVGEVRAYESVALSGDMSTVALDGEWAMVVSTETATVKGAVGSAPDPAATAATTVTSAAYPVPAGIPVPVALKAGDKLKFAAL